MALDCKNFDNDNNWSYMWWGEGHDGLCIATAQDSAYGEQENGSLLFG